MGQRNQDDSDSGRIYAQFDVATDTLASLALLVDALGRSRGDDRWWKWVVVSAHMAANSALVGYLTSTAGVGALTDRATAALMEWLEERHERKDAPPDRIAEFSKLVERAVDREVGFGEPIDMSHLREDLVKLDAVRNRFNHFRPETWWIEKGYLVPKLVSAIQLVRLIDEHGWAFRHAPDAERPNFKLLANSALALLRQS